MPWTRRSAKCVLPPPPNRTAKAPLPSPLRPPPPFFQSPEQESGEDHSGSTAVCALLTPTHVIFGNVGDSRGILVENEGGKPKLRVATIDHKPNNPVELQRIQDSGNHVTMKRVNGDLAVSRALGDFAYKQFMVGESSELMPPEKQAVTCDPEFYVETRKEADAFLILACDGVWDVMENQTVAEKMFEVRRPTRPTRRPNAASSTRPPPPPPTHNSHRAQWTAAGASNPRILSGELINQGLQLNSRDNMSALVVCFPGAPKPPAGAKWGEAAPASAAAAVVVAGGGGSSGSGSSGGGGGEGADGSAEPPPPPPPRF